MHGELRERLVAELTGPTIDRDSLEALRSEQLIQIDELSRTLVDALAGISEVLTPEQRLELAELASHRRHGH
jgi:Spy/CpxP family protein refolding chaperone